MLIDLSKDYNRRECKQGITFKFNPPWKKVYVVVENKNFCKKDTGNRSNFFSERWKYRISFLFSNWCLLLISQEECIQTKCIQNDDDLSALEFIDRWVCFSSNNLPILVYYYLDLNHFQVYTYNTVSILFYSEHFFRKKYCTGSGGVNYIDSEQVSCYSKMVVFLIFVFNHSFFDTIF